jgi:regulator of sigma E protease
LIITILAFLGVLVVLILAHEVGHYVTARISGVKIEEAGLGFPPRLFSIKRGGTRYSINAVPLGGFVKMAGEEDPKVTGSLASKGIAARLLVMGSGSLMNFLLPVLLFSVAFMVPRDIISAQVVVDDVAPASPAAAAGITPGDTLLAVDGNSIFSVGDLQREIQLNMGRTITLLVRHSDSSTEDIQVVPRWRPPEGQGAIGVAIMNSSPTVVRESYPFWQAIPRGIGESIDAFVLFKNAIISMIIGAAPAVVGGPVAIAQLTGEVVKAGFSPLLQFAAFLSINLGIINILPLPALDGGRMVFVLLEWVRRGRRISPRTEGMIHMVGFALLIAFILAVTYQDILRIISGDSLLP